MLPLQTLSVSCCSCSVYIICLSDGTMVDPAADFAGRTAGGSSSGSIPGSSSSADGSSIPGFSSSGLLGPKAVPLNPASSAASSSMTGSSNSSSWGLGHRSVCWWGPRVLALAGGDGSVCLVRLPGSVNVLGAAPARFTPGGLIAQVVINASVYVCTHVIVSLAATCVTAVCTQQTDSWCTHWSTSKDSQVTR